MWPCLEYGSIPLSCGIPTLCMSDINIIEAVQKRAVQKICAEWLFLGQVLWWLFARAELAYPCLPLPLLSFMIDYIHSMFYKRSLILLLLDLMYQYYALSQLPTSTINSFCYSFFVNCALGLSLMCSKICLLFLPELPKIFTYYSYYSTTDYSFLFYWVNDNIAMQIEYVTVLLEYIDFAN